ncbi:hypothetical protein REPUB_Repub09cG0161700 [Reevesia pubescens]
MKWSLMGRGNLGRVGKHPLHGVLKFNVDGSSKGKLGSTGIGGVLRDYKSWLKDPQSMPWRLKRHMPMIDYCIAGISSLSIYNVLRETNDFVVSLAKVGVDMSSDYVALFS